MRIKFLSLAAITVPLLLAGCGGGHYSSPYDGTWQAVYPDDKTSITPTIAVTCNTTPPSVVIENGSGSTTQTMTCLNETFDALGAVISSYTIDYLYNISVAIDGNGKFDAIVNGVPMTGVCISHVGCSAQSGTNTLSLTR